ncbi:phenylalanine--tRNA ligase subunit alpha [candidate division WWE3 bacterium RIFCSPHIGHO2_01_FULL_40_23]|uniref:phenylalanine--tRNA ligase n=1 Tax=candidate division WWE3 bacterium RIFCSPLOWO2_01_FULL_41_18 TaxID=1802625 RepID=A0A1F4VFA6_UNCKA|nr:MAG: phenylalanine--tRNA ligase subunit alpha [candidate division WWE3 bacterium RIFCSPHIGHO2_01_FULL_40_23]OGC55383.1 MAG: phenylalanine--tRNA ligase subunit alpha [candidate division WWE3 bacterium RIFCSPLOWO2_01_FULL_41_18]
MTFENLLSEIKKILKSVDSLKSLNEKKLEILSGKWSILNKLTKELSEKGEGERKNLGIEINKLKDEVEQLITKKEQELFHKEDTKEEWFDATLPVKKTKIGHLSPDTQVIRMMNEFFKYHGYSIAEGPDIELDLYNFEKTNLPKDHPARDLQDTIYIESPEILLRTHTSSVETRILSTHKPPLRFVVPGVSFRNEIINPSNHAIFQQYQGVCVDENISMANLKATLEEFAKFLYGEDTKTRFRTKYYPEVEPGAGMDILCTFCKGEGCRICKMRGWIEILGSGMIHRNLLEKCGLDYHKWSGFAFGMGLDRIIMTKFNISDIRSLHGGSLVFVE